jgi:ribosomal protein L19
LPLSSRKTATTINAGGYSKKEPAEKQKAQQKGQGIDHYFNDAHKLSILLLRARPGAGKSLFYGRFTRSVKTLEIFRIGLVASAVYFYLRRRRGRTRYIGLYFCWF